MSERRREETGEKRQREKEAESLKRKSQAENKEVNAKENKEENAKENREENTKKNREENAKKSREKNEKENREENREKNVKEGKEENKKENAKENREENAKESTKRGGGRAFGKYLFCWLAALLLGFAVISVVFSVYTYLQEKEYYMEASRREEGERMAYLARNINESFTKLKAAAKMTVRDETVQELYCAYDLINSYERGLLLEELQKRCIEIDNLNTFVGSSALYFPERRLRIDKNGYGEAGPEEARRYTDAWEENGVFSAVDGTACMIEPIKKDYRKRSTEPGNILGVFVLELNTALIQEELAFAKISEGDRLVMKDPETDRIYFTDGDGEELKRITLLEGERANVDGKEYPALCYRGENGFFELCYLRDEGKLRQMKRDMRDSILLFVGIAAAGILLALLLVFRKILRPLEVLLVDAFGKLRGGELAYRIPVGGKNGVFEELYKNFNYMAERIDVLVSRELKQEILVNKAKFKHLQAQINPHFMYNSYFLLYRMIKSGDREGSLLLCENLGRFFKYINRDFGEDKSLADEISHAQSYAAIQGCRYRGIIHIDFPGLPEKYHSILVPRLIIQPLLENVFKYVIDEIDEGEEIDLAVSYRETEEELFIRVENSGSITEQRLEEIRKKVERTGDEEEITALANINLRLNTYFDQEGSVAVSRSALGGLAAELRIRL